MLARECWRRRSLGATALHIAAEQTELAVWTLDGLDLRSRLVCIAPVPEQNSLLHDLFDADLRVSISEQRLDRFVADVAVNHRFDLVVFDGEASGRVIGPLISLIAPALSEGGILLLRRLREPGCSGLLEQVRNLSLWSTQPRPGGPCIMSRRAQKPARRRSGRRARTVEP